MRSNAKYIVILGIGVVLWLLFKKSAKGNNKTAPDHAPEQSNTGKVDAAITTVSAMPGWSWLNLLWNK